MTATVAIEEGNGTGPTWTVITVGRYCTADNNNPGSSYPCVVPASGLGYSYWKHHRLAFSGTFTSLSNFRWYCSGVVKTNWHLGSAGYLAIARRDAGAGYHGCPAANYAQAVGTQGANGTPIKDGSAGHAYYKGQTIAVADADTFTSASPLSFDSNTYTSAGASYSVVSQVVLDTDATQGDQPNETFTIRYDEI